MDRDIEMKICLQSIPSLKMVIHHKGSRSWSSPSVRMMSFPTTSSLSRMMSCNRNVKMYSLGWRGNYFNSSCFRGQGY